MLMTTTTIIILLTVAVVVLVLLLVWLIWRNQRQSDELQKKNEVIVREVQRRSAQEGTLGMSKNRYNSN